MSIPQIFALSVTEIVGDFSLKNYANNNGGWKMLAIGAVSYIMVVILLVISLQGSTILMVNNAWDGMSTIIESAAAYIILGERFNNYLQYVGILFIFAGMYLLKIPWKKEHAFHIPNL